MATQALAWPLIQSSFRALHCALPRLQRKQAIMQPVLPSLFHSNMEEAQVLSKPHATPCHAGAVHTCGGVSGAGCRGVSAVVPAGPHVAGAHTAAAGPRPAAPPDDQPSAGRLSGLPLPVAVGRVAGKDLRGGTGSHQSHMSTAVFNMQLYTGLPVHVCCLPRTLDSCHSAGLQVGRFLFSSSSVAPCSLLQDCHRQQCALCGCLCLHAPQLGAGGQATRLQQSPALRCVVGTHPPHSSTAIFPRLLHSCKLLACYNALDCPCLLIQQNVALYDLNPWTSKRFPPFLVCSASGLWHPPLRSGSRRRGPWRFLAAQAPAHRAWRTGHGGRRHPKGVGRPAGVGFQRWRGAGEGGLGAAQ
jgi:hypothetical protein